MKQQENDASLKMPYSRAVTEEESKEEANCYFIIDGVLMRKFTPRNVRTYEEWKTTYQIVAPKKYRKSLLTMGP